MKVKEICDYSGSTLLGMNGGMVESPDSKRIIYARKADLTKSETEIWICDRDFENHRKVYDVHCGNHNGPSATFITNSLIVFRDVILQVDHDQCTVFHIVVLHKFRVPLYGGVYIREADSSEPRCL